MYVEIIFLGVAIFFIMNYTGRVSTNKFIEDNDDIFQKLKEDDYDFYVYAKYGPEKDPNILFKKRMKNAIITLFIVLLFFISSLDYIKFLIAIGIAFAVFKMDYMQLKSYYKGRLHEIDLLLPYYLKNLEILIQHYTVPVAIGKSIETAPPIFKEGLQKMIDEINAGNQTIDPYMEFARNYPVKDSMRMMRLLYRLSLGKQERKQEQLLAFSRTISNLQQKARDTKYKERLEKMEKKTMQMLIITGIGVMILLVISLLMMFSK